MKVYVHLLRLYKPKDEFKRYQLGRKNDFEEEIIYYK